MSRHMRCVTVGLLCVQMLAILSPRAAPCAAEARWAEVPDSFYYPKMMPAVVYDEKDERLIMFGGSYSVSDLRVDESFGPLYVSNQMLAFEDGSWSLLNRYNAFSTIPPRQNVTFAWDGGAGRMIVSGGDAGYSLLGDVWSFDGQTLEKLFESQTALVNRNGALFYNAHRSKVCLVGNDGRVYELSGGGWASLNAGPAPGWGSETGGSKVVFKISYNPSSKKLVAFGGQENHIGQVHIYGSTHVYDAEANSWSRVEGDPSPEPRTNHAMTYSPERGRHVLVGGFRDGVGGLPDVWEFDDATDAWSPVSVENPITMYNNVLVRDAKQMSLLVVGGDNGGQWADRIYELRYVSPAGVSDFILYGDLGKSPEGNGGPTLDRGGEDLEPRQGPAAPVEHAVSDAASER